MSTSVARQLASSMAAAAQWLMPAERHDWMQAMLSDLHHAACDQEAMRWACGCLMVSLNERVKFMMRSNDAKASWPLMVEMMACFLPPTLAWLAFMSDFSKAPSGTIVFLAIALLGLVGPLGLISTLSQVIRGRMISRKLGAGLVGGSFLLAVANLIAFAGPGTGALTVLRDLALIGVLPALGAAHMLVLGSRATRTPATT